jgi:hypothetical protein
MGIAEYVRIELEAKGVLKKGEKHKEIQPKLEDIAEKYKNDTKMITHPISRNGWGFKAPFSKL